MELIEVNWKWDEWQWNLLRKSTSHFRKNRDVQQLTINLQQPGGSKSTAWNTASLTKVDQRWTKIWTNARKYWALPIKIYMEIDILNSFTEYCRNFCFFSGNICPLKIGPFLSNNFFVSVGREVPACASVDWFILYSVGSTT